MVYGPATTSVSVEMGRRQNYCSLTSPGLKLLALWAILNDGVECDTEHESLASSIATTRAAVLS